MESWSPLQSVHTLRCKLKDYIDQYQKVVAADPSVAGHIENALKGASYVIPGASEELSELIYACANILSYGHDALLKHAAGLPLWVNTSPVCQRLQVLLIALEQMEVVIEMVAARYSALHRWLTVSAIVLTKALLRLFLLYRRPSMQTWPVIKPLDRQQYPTTATASAGSSSSNTDELESSLDSTETTSSPVDRHCGPAPSADADGGGDGVTASLDGTSSQPSFVWQGRRMGRVLRSLRDPSDDDPSRRQSLAQLLGVPLPPLASRQLILAEMIYTLRPTVHLLCLLRFGFRSWLPWILSLMMDVASLYVHFSKSGMSPGERAEQSRRLYLLALYLIRSPCYDRQTKHYIIGILKRLSKSLFPVSAIANSCLEYLPTWQRVYFYTWLS